MRSRLLFTALVVLGSAMPARADRYADCKAEVEPDRVIRGCAAIIEQERRESVVLRAGAYGRRGVAYFRKGDLGRAIADYDQAIALDPKYSIAYHNRGYAYSHKGDLDRAIADYDKAIALNHPVLAYIYRVRAKAYEKKGDMVLANADYDKATELEHVAKVRKAPPAGIK